MKEQRTDRDRVRASFERERVRRRKRRQLRRKRIRIAAVLILSVILILLIVIWNLFKKGGNPEKLRIPDWIEQDFIPENPYSRPGIRLHGVEGIVVHYVANPGTTAEQTRNYFAGLAEQTGEGGLSVSSHFVIGLDGGIIQNMPLWEVAYASNSRNYDTISIECCHPDETGEFTRETYESLVRLTAWLSKELKIKNDSIIRHYDIKGKPCPKYFVDHEDAWLKFKEDVKYYKE